MPRHASRRRARCRARLADKCCLAHADAACACPGRHENARARGKAAGLFLTASRSRVTAAGQKRFPILPNVPSRAPAPARHKATDFTATCAATTRAVPKNRGRRLTIAGELRTFRANPGGDPSTKCPTRPPNSRDGEVCDAVFRTKPAEGGQPFAFLPHFFIYVQIGSE